MDTPIEKHAKSLTRKAYWHLLWETYAPVLALAVLCICLFIAGATAGLWQRIGDPWRLIALLCSLGLMVRAAIKARQQAYPNASQARRRVEEDNHINHRPFDTVTDSPAWGHPDDPAWQNHVSAAKVQVLHAAPSQLRAVLAPLDTYYLRYVAIALLVLMAMVGSGDNYERLRASLAPHWVSGIWAQDARYEAWIDPPEYTGRPPSYFRQSNAIQTPEGSEFVARISGVKTAPRLILRTNGRTRAITPIRLGPKSFEARTVITKNTVASFRIAASRTTWILNVDQDLAPRIHFDDPPSAGKRDKLIFTYTLQDDFGVENLSLSMHLQADQMGADPNIIETVSVSLPGSSVRSTDKEPTSLDMSKHKWAGKVVIGHLVAVDGKGQIGLSEPQEFIVPDKIFVEPLAKAVAEQRLLMLASTQEYVDLKPLKPITIESLATRPLFAVERPERTLERAPLTVQRTAELIEVITDQPVGIYDDPSIYMGLRNIYRRLHGAKNQDDLSGIPQDLWTIALRAEFGLVGDALEDMRAAERALNNAMARRAPQREIDTLFDRYDAAVERYMEELTLKAIKDAKNNAENGDGEGGGGGGDFESDEIQKLLDAIEEANRMGDTVAARKALAQLAQLLENMKIEMSQSGGSGGSGPSDGGMSDELKQALEELNDVLGEQRQLRDETQSAGRAENDRDQRQQNGEQATPGESPPKSSAELADEQSKLQELLKKMEGGAQSGSGENPDDENNGGAPLLSDDVTQALKDAKSAMREAGEALEDGQFYRAGREQSKAIDALREAGGQLYAQEAKRLQENADRDGQETGNAADPFGRENDGNSVGDDLELPQIDDRARARELLEKLRKRSGEQDRNKIEREYLERLLERF